MTLDERKQKQKALFRDILFIWAPTGSEPPKDENDQPVKWKCLRCKAIVDMIAFRCECTTSPSPWEPIL